MKTYDCKITSLLVWLLISGNTKEINVENSQKSKINSIMLLGDKTHWHISKDKMSYSTQTLPVMLDYTAFIESRTNL